MGFLAQASSQYEVDPTVAVIGLVVALSAVTVCFLKGKPGMAIAGLFISIVAIVGAIRIAKPDSWWARKHYSEGDGKMYEARVRFGQGIAAESLERRKEEVGAAR